MGSTPLPGLLTHVAESSPLPTHFKPPLLRRRVLCPSLLCQNRFQFVFPPLQALPSSVLVPLSSGWLPVGASCSQAQPAVLLGQTLGGSGGGGHCGGPRSAESPSKATNMAWRTRSVRAGTSSALSPFVGTEDKTWTMQRPAFGEKDTTFETSKTTKRPQQRASKGIFPFSKSVKRYSHSRGRE